MTQKRKPKAPAPTVSKHKPVQNLEALARKQIYYDKVLRWGGEEALIHAYHKFTPPNADPESASAMAGVGIKLLIDPAIEHSEKFTRPRPKGSQDALGRLMLDIARAAPKITNDEMRQRLSALADAHDCIVQEVDDDTIFYRIGGKERTVDNKGFESRMTRIRKLIK